MEPKKTCALCVRHQHPAVTALSQPFLRGSPATTLAKPNPQRLNFYKKLTENEVKANLLLSGVDFSITRFTPRLEIEIKHI